MDPRRRRFVIIALASIVLFFLYISVGHPPASVSSAVRAGLDYFLHVPDLPAANSTLGVRLD